MYQRIVTLDEMKESSLFLWGARQTGKSTLLPSARSGIEMMA